MSRKWFIRLLSVFLLALGFMVGYGYKAKKPEVIVETKIETQTEYIIADQLLREEVNIWIQDAKYRGEYQDVVEFYNHLVDDLDLTYLILSAAEVYNIPTNTLMALIWTESNFNPGAVNGKGNKDGSNDKGLMQLNSRYFKGFDRLDPRLNLQHGCLHLRERFTTYGSWDSAVMYYNGFSKKSVAHQAKVLDRERTLDRLFHEWRCAIE